MKIAEFEQASKPGSMLATPIDLTGESDEEQGDAEATDNIAHNKRSLIDQDDSRRLAKTNKSKTTYTGMLRGVVQLSDNQYEILDD